jgi:hypothetical protein
MVGTRGVIFSDRRLYNRPLPKTDQPTGRRPAAVAANSPPVAGRVATFDGSTRSIVQGPHSITTELHTLS